MPRGGRRQGTPGRSYAQRVDLQAGAAAVPIQVATGQQYGMATAQREAQRALPIAAPPPPATAPPAAGGAAPAGRQVPPVQVIPLTDPSKRPGEPVTAGVSIGAGPGPEVLGLPAENGVEDLALWLPLLEFAASQPGATSQMRNFVRRLRGAAPVQ
jgi:hypothetical protein